MLKIEKINAGYNGLEVLKEASLELGIGQIGVLMGPNGAGKSTLLKTIYNLIQKDSGQVFFDDINITKTASHDMLETGICYVPQGKINFNNLSVEDNLYLGALGIKDKKLLESRKKEVFKMFPVLEERAKQIAFSLSGGEQQILALGRALMSRPRLLLLDEPSLGLAPKIIKQVFENIKSINKNFNTTILVVEHNIKSFLSIADMAYIMIEGKVVAGGISDKIKKSDIIKKVFIGEFD